MNVFRAAVIVVVLCCLSIPGFAQCDSLEQLFLADPTLRVTSTMGIQGPGSHVPAYAFEYQSDSTRFFMDVSEFRKNGRWVFLDRWCLEKTWNYSQYLDADTTELTNAALSAISGTKPFDVSAGDTLSLFRRIYWEDRGGDTFAFGKLVNPDAVSMWFEILNATTGARIALVDSTHFSSMTATKRPCFQTQHPLTARIVWIAPVGFTTTNVVIRANVSSVGSVNKRWYRYDNIVQAASNIILAYEGTRLFCHTVEQANDCAPTTSTCEFKVSTQNNPKRIRAMIETGASITDVDLYSSNGQFVTTVPVTGGTTSYDFNVDAGLYYVVAKVGTSVRCTRNVVVF